MKDKVSRIGVLMGGPSSEREISLKSGKAVYQALKEEGLDVVALDIDASPQKQIEQAHISLAFIALHGKFGEDGTIQNILESLNIAYTGSRAISSFLCLDKMASREIFKKHELPVPQCQVLDKDNPRQSLEELSLKLPVVVKPLAEGSSIGITFVDNSKKLRPAIEEAFKYDASIIIESYIKGREITVGILNELPLPIVEIVPNVGFFDFQAKYEKGKTEYIVPAKLPSAAYAKAHRIALLAHKALGCKGFSRVDMILKEDTPFILEVNSIPGLTKTSLLPLAAQVQGINFRKLCLEIVRSALNAKQ